MRRLGGVLLACLVVACGADQLSTPQPVLTYFSPMWYEETGRYFQVSPDGRLAIYGVGARLRLYDVTTGREESRGAMNQVRAAVFEPTGVVARLESASGETAWYTDSGGRRRRLDI